MTSPKFWITTSEHQLIPYKHTISTSPAKVHTNASFSPPIHKIHSLLSQTLICILLLNKPCSFRIFHSHYYTFKRIEKNICIYYDHILTKELNLTNLTIILQLCSNLVLLAAVFSSFTLFPSLTPSPLCCLLYTSDAADE